jgi:YD repeat-containing protein
MRSLLAFVVFSLTLLPQVASAQIVPPGTTGKFIGAEPPKTCCSCKCTGSPSSAAPSSGTSSNVSLTEGNLTERVLIAKITPTLSLDAVYNSYIADGSHATVDTVMGFGWTHSYNIFLFSQAGVMFAFDGDGRVTRYDPGPSGTFISSTGYFETLTQSGGVFTITQKDQTKYNFMLIPGTPFMVSGTVYRLISIVDRNHNTTTLTYSGGNLTAVTDTYGRSLTFKYNAQNKLMSVTDPLGQVTTFQYDSTGHKLMQITDPIPKTIKYTYRSIRFRGQPDQNDGRVGQLHGILL